MQKGVQQGRFGSLWFFWLLDPFLGLQQAKSIKNWFGSLYFGFPWSDVSFSSCWTPFCAVSGLDPPKRGPPQLGFRLATFSCCMDPLFVPSATWILQKGSCDLDSNLLPQPLFMEALYLCWLSLFLPLLVAVALCAAVVAWVSFPFCSKICRAYPLYKGRLAQPVRHKALDLKIAGSSPPWV